MTNARPLRGRSAALARAVAVLHRAYRHETGGLVLITGPAGIGKTALLAEMLRQARRMNFQIATSSCDEIGQTWPAAAILSALRKPTNPLLTTTEYAEISALVGQPLPLAERIAAHLEDAAREQPVLLAVDDLQWADQVSRFILRTLLSQSVGLPIVLVLASRDPSFDTALPGADSIEHLALDALTMPDVLAVARDHLGRMPDVATSRLLETTDGNPFLVADLLDNLRTAYAASEPGTVPTGFTLTVHSRLLGLDDAAADLVRLVAVAGRPLPIGAALPLLSGLHPDADVTAAARAVASGLLADTADATLVFRHDLVREAVYAGLSETVRRGLHRRFADRLIDGGADPLHIAAHARAAACPGDAASAAVLLQAAEQLTPVNADAAADLAARAFGLLRPAHPDWLDVSRRCLAILAHAQRANDVLDIADLILARVDDPDLAGRIETDTARALWLNGRPELLITRVDALVNRHPTIGAAVAARLAAVRALARTRTTLGSTAAAESAAALNQARTAADPVAVTLAQQAAGEAAKNEGRHRDALRHFRKLRTDGGGSYVAEEIMALQMVDRYDHAKAMLDQAFADDARNTETAVPSLLYAQLWQDFNLGRLDDADTGAQTLIDLDRQLGTHMYALEAIMIRSAVALLRGEPATATLRLQPAVTLTTADDNIRLPGLTLMKGWLAASTGDIETALTTLRPVLFAARESRTYWAWWPGWMNAFFHIGLAGADPDFAGEAVAIAELGAQRNLGIASFAGLADLLRAQLDGGDLDRLAAAAGLLATSPRPALRAVGAETYGRALLAVGDRPSAIEQLDRAWGEYDHMHAWAGRANVQRTLRDNGVRRETWTARPASNTGWGALTESERRVATLIAAGHTNKTAAKSLGVSTNTIGTHLRSIFAKLGVQSRVQLANVLHTAPAPDRERHATSAVVT